MTNLPLSQQSRRSDSNSNDKGFGHDGIHINHVGFVLDDMDETVRRIHALGLRLEGNDATVDWPRSRSAYVMDPNGILIEITNRTSDESSDWAPFHHVAVAPVSLDQLVNVIAAQSFDLLEA